jgi:hypothetical protein
VDGKSDWLISIMKDFDWLQVHINNSFKNSSVKAQNKDIQKCNFHYKTVRRFFTEIAGSLAAMFLASALKRGIHPPGILHFQYVYRGGDCLSLGHLLRTWRTEKIPYAKLT